jgi:hypothetical protein
MTLHGNFIRQCVLGALVLTPFSAVAQLSIAGKISWTDSRGPSESGSKHPAREVNVEICDVNLPPDSQVLSVVVTDDLGIFTASLPIAPGEHRDIVIRGRSESPAGKVEAVGTSETFILPSQTYVNQTSGKSIHADVVGQFRAINNAAFSVLDALLGARQFVSKVSHVNLAQIAVEFPTAKSTSSFDGSVLHILFLDKWDWDVIMHEYGHYVSKSFSLDQNPGGPHAIDENLGDRLRKDKALCLAWGEGWPTYFAITAQIEMGMASFGIPNVGDTRYTDTEDSNLDFDLASNDGVGSLGEDNEVSVMRVLYDVGQAKSGIGLSPSDVWNILVAAKPVTFSSALTAIDTNETLKQIVLVGYLSSKHKIAPLVRPTQLGPTLPDSSPTLTWTANGGGVKHRNNQFTLRFYDSSMKLILKSDTISTTRYQPTVSQWKRLRDGGFAFWLVTGVNNDAPPTGPYYSGLQPARLLSSASAGNR